MFRVAVLYPLFYSMNSRRRFLQTVLLASGATFVGLPLGCTKNSRNALQQRTANARPALSTTGQRFAGVHKMLRDNAAVPTTAQHTRSCDVVVIGAGPSGLTACRMLHTMGFSTLLLDSEPHIGGAGVHGEYNGVRYPLGSVYLVEYDGIIKDMLADAGTQPLLTPDDALVVDNTHFHDFWSDRVISTLPVSPQERDALRSFRNDFLSLHVEPSYPLPASLPPELAALDNQSARAYLHRYNSPLLNSIINAYALSSMGGSADEVNAYCLLNFYASEFGNGFNLPRYTFRGGLHEFMAAIAKPLPTETFLPSHIAFHLANTPNGVTLHCLDNNDEVLQITAKAAVVGIQKFAVPFLIPDLPTPQKEAIAQLRYSPFATIHLCSSKPLLAHNAFDTWLPHTPGSCTDILNPSSLYPEDSKNFVYSLYAPQPPSNRGTLMNEELFAAFIRQTTEQTLPALGGTTAEEAIEAIHGWAWGHSIVQAGIGTHSGIAQRASQPFGNVFFANTDNDASPAIENAVQHGALAAEAIHQRLHATGTRSFHSR